MASRRQVVLDRLLSGSIVLLAAGAVAAIYLAFHPIGTQKSATGDAARAASPSTSVPGHALSEAELAVVWNRLEPNDATGRRLAEHAATASLADREAEARDGSALPFKVRGIIYSRTAALSAAFIEVNGKVERYEPGQKVGDWTLSTVAMDSLLFSRNGEEKEVYIEASPAGPRPSNRTASDRTEPEPTTVTATLPGASGPGQRGPRSTAAGADAAQPARRIVASTSAPVAAPPAAAKDCDARVSVASQDVDRVRDDPTIALQGVKCEPQFDGQGGMNGVLLSSVSGGSLAARYSLAPGDRILAVNGQPINSPSRAMELYNEFRDNDSVQVQIERNGRRMNVMFYVN